MSIFRIGVRSLILYNRKVLLVQRPNTSWELPGGTLEFGEDLHVALRREIKEETDLDDIRIEKLLYAVTMKMGPDRQDVGLMYLSYASSDKVKISNEHIDALWADKEQMLKLLNSRMLNELKENAVLDLLEID